MSTLAENLEKELSPEKLAAAADAVVDFSMAVKDKLEAGDIAECRKTIEMLHTNFLLSSLLREVKKWNESD